MISSDLTGDLTEDRWSISRFQSGDAGAFDDLMRRHQGMVYNLAYRLTKNHDEAGDLVAETFFRVFRALNRFRGDSSFRSWLYPIELNCFIDIRSKARYGSIISLDAMVNGSDGLVALNMIDDRETAHDRVVRRERVSAIGRAMKRLTPDQREVFMMYQADAMSYEDIASALEVPIGTIKSRLNRARCHIRQTIRMQRLQFADQGRSAAEIRPSAAFAG